MNHQFMDFTDDLAQTESRLRTKTFNGKEYTVQATDPYGHWHVVGTKVESLKGTYTTPERAFLACEIYENNKAKEEQAKLDKQTIWSTDGKGNKARVKREDHEKAPATVV